MKDTIFKQKHTINCKGNLISLDRPLVMGIVNVTPDSFYDGDKNKTTDLILATVERHLNEGARFIDVGGCSSRPGALNISFQEEGDRVLPAIEAIQKEFPLSLISVDTYRSQVAKQAVRAGACIVNDISAGGADAAMFGVIAELNIPYILMHMQNTPKDMQVAPSYDSLITDIGFYFSEKINALKKLGINDLILDVGFGFGKTILDNYQLLKELQYFQMFNLPILIGVSRKSMFYKYFDTTPQESLNATTAAHMIGLLNGAKILRVHDVKAAKEAVEIFQLTK